MATQQTTFTEFVSGLVTLIVVIFIVSKCSRCSEEKVSPETLETSRVVMIESDSLLATTYKEKINALYDGLLALDKVDDGTRSRRSYHDDIQKLFEDWYDNMDYLVDKGILIPTSNKEHAALYKKYDKQFARFALYGDEDIGGINYWAKSEAETILKKLLVDPKSLEIDDVICNGKTNKGWKCTVIYRAKNGFGGYVREYLTLIMAYDMDHYLYQCVDAR